MVGSHFAEVGDDDGLDDGGDGSDGGDGGCVYWLLSMINIDWLWPCSRLSNHTLIQISTYSPQHLHTPHSVIIFLLVRMFPHLHAWCLPQSQGRSDLLLVQFQRPVQHISSSPALSPLPPPPAPRLTPSNSTLVAASYSQSSTDPDRLVMKTVNFSSSLLTSFLPAKFLVWGWESQTFFVKSSYIDILEEGKKNSDNFIDFF